MRYLILFALVALTACSERGRFFQVPDAAQVGTVTPIYVATTRTHDPSEGFDGSGFNGGRSDTTSYARYDVSIPPERTLGEVKWPTSRNPPNPLQDFLITSEALYPDKETFNSDISRRFKEKNNRALVFVHGFNTNVAEGSFRIAQISHDLALPGVPILYSWPSAARALGYAYDRDSTLFARDGFEHMLDDLIANGGEEIILIAHSMGSSLMMETLRQMAIRKNSAVLSRIRAVVLISPDIDVDVFHSQATAIKPLPEPFIIFSSERDRILRLSAGLTGERARLGSLTDLRRVEDLPVTFVDTAAFTKGAGHFNFQSPELIAMIDQFSLVERALDQKDIRKTGLIPGLFLTVKNATELVLEPFAEAAERSGL